MRTKILTGTGVPDLELISGSFWETSFMDTAESGNTMVTQ